MDDHEWNATRIRASICPSMETRWEKPETSHWIALHKCGNELRGSVGKTLAAIEAVDRDKGLSSEGKRERKRGIGTKALDELEQPGSVLKAREAVAAQMKRWAEKVAVHVKPAQDHAEAVLHAQIREKVGNLKEGRLTFLQKHASDPTVASALLEAPPFLSNLSEAELAQLRIEVEKKYLSPEIVEAKGKVTNALLETERSLRAGQAMIRNSAGVDKPSAAELAMARPQRVDA